MTLAIERRSTPGLGETRLGETRLGERRRERAQRSEPRERSEPAKRRARERVGESEGRSPSDESRRMRRDCRDGNEAVMTEYPSELIGIIHDVRKRWRRKVALRGGAIAAGLVAASLVLSALVLQWLRFTPESILGFRILLALVVAVVAWALLIRPQMRRVTDEQVALYLEEHEPSLQAAIISAIEAERSGTAAQSPALVR